MMTGCEIAKRCIEFRDPPRIALDFLTSAVDGWQCDVTDFGFVGYAADPDFVPTAEGIDEWGIGMQTLDPTGQNFGQPKINPLRDGWRSLDKYQFPDLTRPGRYAHMEKWISDYRRDGKYVYGHIIALMQQTMALRGIQNWLADHAAELDSLCLLLDKIVEMNLSVIDRYAEFEMDGVIVWDDMGINDRGLVSPATFRAVYLPRYKRIIDALHERGMHFIHHCCGYVREYMDMFVEAGWDVLQLDQPNLMGIKWLADNYGGKICFWNPVDIQTTMPGGDIDEIASEACKQITLLGGFSGGYMFKAYQQPTAVSITPRAAQAQYEAVTRYGVYDKTV